MVEEEDSKLKIFNTIHMNHSKETPKKKYFRIEKDKPYSLIESKSKAIFRTKKDYNFLRRKTLRDIENQKLNKINNFNNNFNNSNNNNNKFITTTVDDTTISAQSDNSFLVLNIIPRKLIVTKENKNGKKDLNEYSKEKHILLRALFRQENNENFPENNKNLNLNLDEKSDGNNERGNGSGDRAEFIKNIEKYKLKFMIVYFYSIKNLCKYINNNLFNTADKENKDIENYLYDAYQDLRILNNKINEFKIFQNMKDSLRLKLKEEEFNDIITLKQNMQYMKNLLKKTISEKLNNIYINIENFCNLFMPSYK